MLCSADNRDIDKLKLTDYPVAVQEYLKKKVGEVEQQLRVAKDVYGEHIVREEAPNAILPEVEADCDAIDSACKNLDAALAQHKKTSQVDIKRMSGNA